MVEYKYGTRDGEPLVWVITMDPRLGDDEDKKVLMTASELVIKTERGTIIIDETEGSKLAGEVVPKGSLATRIKDGVTNRVRRIGAVAGG